VKNRLNQRFQLLQFAIKEIRLWRYGSVIGDIAAYFQRRNFMSKIWPRHSIRRPRFPIRPLCFHYRMPFAQY